MTDRKRENLTKEFEELYSLGYHGRPPVISPVDSSDGWNQSMQDAGEGEMPTLRYMETVSIGAMAGFTANQVTYYITLKIGFFNSHPSPPRE